MNRHRPWPALNKLHALSAVQPAIQTHRIYHHRLNLNRQLPSQSYPGFFIDTIHNVSGTFGVITGRAHPSNQLLQTHHKCRRRLYPKGSCRRSHNLHPQTRSQRICYQVQLPHSCKHIIDAALDLKFITDIVSVNVRKAFPSQS